MIASQKQTPPAKPLKVMHICGSRERSGTEKVFLRFVRAQIQAGVYEVVPLVAQDGWLEKVLKKSQIPHHAIKFPQGFFKWLDRKTSKHISALLTVENPDIVQSWAHTSGQFLPKMLCPHIVRLGFSSAFAFAKKADYLVAASPSVCKRLEQAGVQKQKIKHIPTLVNIPPKGFQEFRYDVRIEYNIPADAFLVLMLGHLHEEKGFDVALFSLNLLPENVHVLIVGEGPQQRALKDAVMADGLGSRVHFAGWIDNTSPLFAAADIFLMPSRHKPSSNVILEAWAHRLPVVSTMTGASKVLIKNKKTGILVPPENEVALAQGVETFMQDPALALKVGQAGAKEVQKSFSAQKVLKAYDALYREAIKAKNS